MSPRIVSGRVSWFNLDKKFGFVELERGLGDAFLHVSALKEAGYVSVPAGRRPDRTMRVIEVTRHEMSFRLMPASKVSRASISDVHREVLLRRMKYQIAAATTMTTRMSHQ